MLPNDHPLRFELTDEVHARPPETLKPPLRITYLALVCDAACREQESSHLASLTERYGVAPPAPGANHFSVDLGPFRLKWERHTEFMRFKFIVPGVGEEPFADPAISRVPEDWLAGLQGELMVATNVTLVAADDRAPDYEAISRRHFAGNVLIGSAIASGSATALSDLRVHPDGFGRLLVQDRRMTPRQAGRMIQRLMEIDTYRLMALLALPVARRLTPVLAQAEHELVDITAAQVRAGERDEPALLERLTRLQAEIESLEAEHHYRFSAADAYHALVQRRVEELREERIEGIQTLQEFTERRLAPAISTVRAVAARQNSLSLRMSRATHLLSTRVGVAREGQNRALLESMNRRAKLQLRLQQTVEGLSVAAITYYIVGLVGYAAKALKAAHPPLGFEINPDIVTGIAIPVVAILVGVGVRRIRRFVTRQGS